MKRRRRQIGIQDLPECRRAFIRVAPGPGGLKSKRFPLGTPDAELLAWRDRTAAQYGKGEIVTGSLAAMVAAYLAKPDIAAKKYIHQRAHHLAFLVGAFGGSRPATSVQQDDIEALVQQLLTRYGEATVYHYRSSWNSCFETMCPTANPVKGTTRPDPDPNRGMQRGATWQQIEAILEAMPDVRYISPGIQKPAFAKLWAMAIYHTGMPAAELKKLKESYFDWDAGSVRMPWRDKGKGTPPYLKTLLPEAVAAFRAIDAAGAWGHQVGRLATSAYSRSFKRAARRLYGDDTPIHFYAMRHTMGQDVYDRTKDLAAVRRALGHVPGSVMAERYAMGANAAVDKAAMDAVRAMRAEKAPAPVPALSYRPKLPEKAKANRRNKLQKVS